MMPTGSPGLRWDSRHFLLVPRPLPSVFNRGVLWPGSVTIEEVPMDGLFLRFYVHENRKHRHVLLYEWLLEEAKKLGIHGGTAFRAVAGFGHHGTLHFQHF